MEIASRIQNSGHYPATLATTKRKQSLCTHFRWLPASGYSTSHDFFLKKYFFSIVYNCTIGSRSILLIITAIHPPFVSNRVFSGDSLKYWVAGQQ